MSLIHPTPLHLGRAAKHEVRTQFAALCWRRHKGEVQVLLITSLAAKRWIVPKGWPMHGATAAEAALTEAWEEAGVEGSVKNAVMGIFAYRKAGPKAALPCVCAVFPVKVRRLAGDYPEAGRRRRKWFSPKKAGRKVDDPELARILRQFDPDRL